MPFWAVALLAVGVLMAGWLGGVGGRSWRDRARYAEIEERFEGLERRLSKREGQAGQQRKQQGSATEQADLAALMRLRPAGAGLPGPEGPTLVEGPDADAAAHEHFKRKDRAAR